jgi:hypothetical protein
MNIIKQNANGQAFAEPVCVGCLQSNGTEKHKPSLPCPKVQFAQNSELRTTYSSNMKISLVNSGTVAFEYKNINRKISKNFYVTN